MKKMKTIGLLGGMSWESTLEYYRLINEQIKSHYGGSHSARLLMYSFDYDELEQLLNRNDWNKILDLLVEYGLKLKNAGAEYLVLCANTMHIVADQVEQKVGLPLIHIGKATLDDVLKKDIKKVALLGTKYTMQSHIYPELFNQHSIEIMTPTTEEQDMIHHVIYKELILGVFSEQSKHEFLNIIKRLKSAGAQGVILGCTEIPLLIKQSDVDCPVFNTLNSHVNHIVKKMVT
jgi:aspartate racemase